MLNGCTQSNNNTQSTAKAICSYSLNGTDIVITDSNISVFMPYGTNVTVNNVAQLSTLHFIK